MPNLYRGSSAGGTPESIDAGRWRVDKYLSGNWYFAPTFSFGSGATNNTTDRMWLMPFEVEGAGGGVAFDRIGVYGGGYPAGAIMRLGAYLSDANGLPDTGALIFDAGTVDMAAAAADKTIVIAETLSPGRVWLAAAQQLWAAGGTIARADVRAQAILGSTALLNAATGALYVVGVSGALPNPAGATTQHTAEGVRIHLRAA